MQGVYTVKETNLDLNLTFRHKWQNNAWSIETEDSSSLKSSESIDYMERNHSLPPGAVEKIRNLIFFAH